MFPVDNRLSFNSAFDNLFPRSLGSCIPNSSQTDAFRSEWSNHFHQNARSVTSIPTTTANAMNNNNPENNFNGSKHHQQQQSNTHTYMNNQLNVRQHLLPASNDFTQTTLSTSSSSSSTSPRPNALAAAFLSNSFSDSLQANSQNYQNPNGFPNCFTPSSSSLMNSVNNDDNNNNNNNNNNGENMKISSFRPRSEFNHFDLGLNASRPMDLLSNCSTHLPISSANSSNSNSNNNNTVIHSSNNNIDSGNLPHDSIHSFTHNSNNTQLHYNRFVQPNQTKEDVGAFHPLVSSYSSINLLNSSIRYPSFGQNTSDLMNSGSQRIDMLNPFLDFRNSTTATSNANSNAFSNPVCNQHPQHPQHHQHQQQQTVSENLKSTYRHFTNTTAAAMAAAAAVEAASSVTSSMNNINNNNNSSMMNMTSPEMIRTMGQSMVATSSSNHHHHNNNNSNNTAVAVAAIAAAAAATNYMVANNTGMSNFGVSTNLNLSGQSRESGLDCSDITSSPSSTPCGRLNKSNNNSNNNSQIETNGSVGNHGNNGSGNSASSNNNNNSNARSSLSPTHIWPWMTVVGKLYILYDLFTNRICIV
ncbi:unnamed protein product [Trichobilharzia regenti]|nr:unnamed protein product [Trichobilharzia regenti]